MTIKEHIIVFQLSYLIRYIAKGKQRNQHMFIQVMCYKKVSCCVNVSAINDNQRTHYCVSSMVWNAYE